MALDGVAQAGMGCFGQIADIVANQMIPAIQGAQDSVAARQCDVWHYQFLSVDLR